MEVLRDIICCGVAIIAIQLLFIGSLEIYARWNKVNKLRKGKK